MSPGLGRAALFAAAATLACGASQAAPAVSTSASPVSAAFGNTILMVYPDRRVAELWLQPGGAYDGEGRKGDRTGGRWQVKGARLCLKQTRPFPAPFSFCRPLPASYRGWWSDKAFTGEAIRVTIIRGHVEKPRALTYAKGV